MDNKSEIQISQEKDAKKMKEVKYSRAFYKCMKSSVGVLFLPLFRTKYTNPRAIPKEGRYIVAANHINAIDPILIGIGQRRSIRFMAKAELFKSSFTNWFFHKIGAFPVNRGKGDWDSINKAKAMIDEGDAIGIFIEGTRSKTGELLRPKSGAVMIAHQMDCMIIPASITYRSKKNRLFSRKFVRFGEPVSVADLGIVNGGPREYREASRQLMEKIKVLWEADKYGNKTC